MKNYNDLILRTMTQLIAFILLGSLCICSLLVIIRQVGIYWRINDRGSIYSHVHHLWI